MADTLYAWSPIRADGKVVAKMGDAVTADKLGVDKENFEALVEAGVLRKVKPPDLAKEGFSGSVVEWHQKQAREAAEAAGASAEEAGLAAFHEIGEVG